MRRVARLPRQGVHGAPTAAPLVPAVKKKRPGPGRLLGRRGSRLDGKTYQGIQALSTRARCAQGPEVGECRTDHSRANPHEQDQSALQGPVSTTLIPFSASRGKTVKSIGTPRMETKELGGAREGLLGHAPHGTLHEYKRRPVPVAIQINRSPMFNILKTAKLAGPEPGGQLSCYVSRFPRFLGVDRNFLKAILKIASIAGQIAQPFKHLNEDIHTLCSRNSRRPEVHIHRIRPPPNVDLACSPGHTIIGGTLFACDPVTGSPKSRK